MAYKFSWSPRGVLLAGSNTARYRERGVTVDVPKARLFAAHFVAQVEGLGDLEAYPNRDSLPYVDVYGIPETDTMYRGALRHLGWCDVTQKLNELGYFSLEECADLAGKTSRQIMADPIGSDDAGDLGADLAAAINVAPNSGVMMALDWLGPLGDEPAGHRTTLPDALADLMPAGMRYKAGKRDMVLCWCTSSPPRTRAARRLSPRRWLHLAPRAARQP